MSTVKLADIAKKTGFSINTVSHALNNKPDISEKTKAVIVKAANEMGYIANISASSLRSGKSKSVAIIVGDISNPYFAIMIKEMESRLRDFQYNAIIFNTEEDEELEYAAIVSAIGKKVDGIILSPVQKTRNNYSFLKKSNIPFVMFGRRFEGESCSYCISDEVNGGFVAAQHLIKLGHRQLLFINAPEYISSARDRLEGTRRAVAESKEKSVSLQVAEVSSFGNEADIQKILTRNAACTGIICFSDLIAMQVWYHLKKMGKSVPRDVSIIGFDNIASKHYSPNMLTSVSSSKTKMSRLTVETLMEMIENPEEQKTPKQYVLPTEIIERESTGYKK